MVFPKASLVPPAYTLRDDGSVEFCLYYPNAESVELRIMSSDQRLLSLSRESDFWTGVESGLEGFVAINVLVNGDIVLDGRLPIGFYGNRPTNFIELLCDDQIVLPRAAEHGSVAAVFLKSRVSGKLERILLYLPAGYMNGSNYYPVLYLQHGFGENETVWVSEGKMNFIFDNLVASGKASPAIVVMCNGMMTFEDEENVYVAEFKKFEQMLIEEIIPYVDSHYRTYADAEHRAMAGLSMGSIQTSYITMRHPELFRYAGVFSGFVRNFLTGENEHLQHLDGYSDRLKVYFRGIGDQDEYLFRFQEDDVLLEEHGVSSIRKIYSGAHEWKVWQRCFYDFIQMIFK